MTAVLPIVPAKPLAPPGWRLHLAVLAGAWAALLLLFHRDLAHLFGIWVASSTFNHCLLIPPLIGWLVWQRLPELRRLTPRAWWPGLLLVGAGAASWLVGEAGSAAIARHLGLVLMLQGTAVACLGPAVSRGLLFPIAYALFLIPAGEELVPPMQTVTAKLSMLFLALVNVPASIRGIFITTPSGLYEVAAACSGVKVIVAMTAYAALAANVCFRSWSRRALFVAFALAVPILANGVRAGTTIYVASLTNNRYATGFDHLVYGWIFFALVIALVMGAAWPFFDRKPGEPWFDPATLQASDAKAGPPRRLAAVAAAALGLAFLPPAWSAALASTQTAPVTDISLPAVAGWERVPGDKGRYWEPHFAGADYIRMGRYRDSAGHEVDLAIAVYARQQDGRELISQGQGAVLPDGAWAWTSNAPPPPHGKSERIFSNGTVREVASFYRVGGILTGSRTAAKIEMIRARILGGPQRAVAVLVSAEERQGEGSARPAIDAFLASLGPVARVADAAGRPEPR